VIRLGQMGELLQKDPQLLARVLEGWLDRPGNPPRAAG
jgi:hypothetical protein